MERRQRQREADMRENQEREEINHKVEHARKVVNSKTFDAFLVGADTVVKKARDFRDMFHFSGDDDSDKTYVLNYSEPMGYDHRISEHRDEFKSYAIGVCEEIGVSSHKFKHAAPGHKPHQIHATFKDLTAPEHQRLLDRWNPPPKRDDSCTWMCYS